MQTLKSVFYLTLPVLAFVALSGCANTIRGVGTDAANTVDATQDAGGRVVRAVN